MRICAIVLAGGQSGRMGRDKLRLAVREGEDMTVLQHVIQVASSVAADTYVVTAPDAPEEALPQGARAMADENTYRGPLVALSHALQRLQVQAGDAAYDAFLVCAGDLPGLSREVVTQLVVALQQATPDIDAAVVVREGRVQPLLAVYRRDAGRVFVDVERSGLDRIFRALDRMNITTINADEEHWPVWWTKPIHTPTDYDDWLREGRDSI